MRRTTVVLALALLAGCGGGSNSTKTIRVGDEQVSAARLEAAAEALCTARDQAKADVKQADTTFYDRSHDALHTIARALDQVDRAAAAELLEDKERVETDLRADSPAPNLAADLDRLARSTRTGLAALSISVPACPR